MSTITLQDAKQIVAAAQKHAERIGKPLTVVVTDITGFPVLVERMDGARPLQTEIATAKAYTGAIMQRPGTMLKGWESSEPGVFGQVSRMGHKPVIAAHGALPVKKDGTVVGGIGVSGGSGEEDEAVAQASLDDTGYELDFPGFKRATLD